jgi:hypothetical protein
VLSYRPLNQLDESQQRINGECACNDDAKSVCLKHKDIFRIENFPQEFPEFRFRLHAIAASLFLFFSDHGCELEAYCSNLTRSNAFAAFRARHFGSSFLLSNRINVDRAERTSLRALETPNAFVCIDPDPERAYAIDKRLKRPEGAQRATLRALPRQYRHDNHETEKQYYKHTRRN